MSSNDSHVFEARYFDGRVAQAQPARVWFHGGELVMLLRASGARTWPLAQLRVAEQVQHAPQVVMLPHGASLQLPGEAAGFAEALAAQGVRPGLVQRLQRAWAASAAALLLLVGLVAWCWLVGLPLAADWMVERMPPAWEQRLGAQVLETLDRRSLLPSGLDSGQRERLARRFAQLARQQTPGLVVRVEFRRSRDGSPNAFALPGGTIVLLDQLVDFAEHDDDVVLGVLAHELGHQQHRHMTRSLVRGLGNMALAGLLWGDYSSVASNATALLRMLSHSREAEEEADGFALRALVDSGIGVEGLADFFERVDEKYGDSMPEWLATHPAGADRAQRLRDAADAVGR